VSGGITPRDETLTKEGDGRMKTTQIQRLTRRWRSHAEMFERFDEEGIATVFSTCADELEAAVAVWGDELFTLEEAERDSGYSADSLGRLIREGIIPNGGQTGVPRIRRRDLPRKPGGRNGRCRTDGLDSVEQIVASVVDSEGGVHDG
jgi:hypothetical protein